MRPEVRLPRTRLALPRRPPLLCRRRPLLLFAQLLLLACEHFFYRKRWRPIFLVLISRTAPILLKNIEWQTDIL